MNRILVMGGSSWLGCFDFPIVSGFPALFFAHRFWDDYGLSVWNRLSFSFECSRALDYFNAFSVPMVALRR